MPNILVNKNLLGNRQSRLNNIINDNTRNITLSRQTGRRNAMRVTYTQRTTTSIRFFSSRTLTTKAYTTSMLTRYRTNSRHTKNRHRRLINRHLDKDIVRHINLKLPLRRRNNLNNIKRSRIYPTTRPTRPISRDQNRYKMNLTIIPRREIRRLTNDEPRVRHLFNRHRLLLTTWMTNMSAIGLRARLPMILRDNRPMNNAIRPYQYTRATHINKRRRDKRNRELTTRGKRRQRSSHRTTPTRTKRIIGTRGFFQFDQFRRGKSSFTPSANHAKPDFSTCSAMCRVLQSGGDTCQVLCEGC